MAFNSGYAYPPPPPPVDSSRTDGQYAYGSNNIHKKFKLNSGQSSNQNYGNNDKNYANYDENYVNSFYQSSSYSSYPVSYENSSSTYGYTDSEQGYSSQFVRTNYTGEKGYYTNSSNWGSDYVENGFGGGYQMSDKGPGGGGRGMNRGRDSGGAGSRVGGAQRGGFRDEGERRDFFKDRREEGRESWSGGSRGSSGQRTDGNRGGRKRGGGSWDGRERGGGSRGGIERGGGSWGGGERGGGSWGGVAKGSEPRGDRGGGSQGRELRDNGGRRGRGPEFRPKSTVIKPKHPPITSEQRQRIENNNLKQLVAPKPPHKILSEMVGRSVKYEYTDNPPLPPGVVELQEMHTLLTTIDGDKSSGTGPSFDIAKNICSEHAIMTVVAKRYEAMNKTVAEGSKTKEELLIEDETPFELASIAVFKMLNEWEAKGFELPQDLEDVLYTSHLFKPVKERLDWIRGCNLGFSTPLQSSDQPVVKSSRRKPMQMPEPAVIEQKHPVAFLNEIRGHVNYVDLGVYGTGDSQTFTVGTNIDGVPYSGTGSSKKEARRSCAADILDRVYRIKVPCLSSSLDQRGENSKRR